MREQKDFHCGAAECKPTQGKAWSLVPGFWKTTELHSLSHHTRLYSMLSRRQIPWFLPSLRDLTNRFWIPPPLKTTMLQCHASPLLTETPCQLLERKPQWEEQCLTDWQKSTWVSIWCSDRGWNNNSLRADRHMLHFLLDINFSFNLFIRVGIKKLSTELGWGLWKDYAAVSHWDTCPGFSQVAGVRQESNWPKHTLNLSM